MGLSPVGALGMTLFAVDLYVASSSLPANELMSIHHFVTQPAHWRVMADLLLLSFCAGIYSVPMYALIQQQSHNAECARIIAANNIINALFMIASSLIAGSMLEGGFTIPEVIGWTGVANAAVTLGIFLAEPNYLRRFAAWMKHS